MVVLDHHEDLWPKLATKWKGIHTRTHTYTYDYYISLWYMLWSAKEINDKKK